MGEHLGYRKHDPAGRETDSNSRNGTRELKPVGWVALGGQAIEISMPVARHRSIVAGLEAVSVMITSIMVVSAK